MSLEDRQVADRVRIQRIVLICVVAYGLVTAVRLTEAGRWMQGRLEAKGEYLLASNDAYAWVAGAEGDLPATAGSLPAVSLRTLSRWTGASPAWLAFWLPPFLAGLSVMPVVAWAGFLGAREIALPAGVLASLAPAYYTRTRLGYFDTDWATMFFPLCLALVLVVWLQTARRMEGAVQRPQRSFFLASVLVLLLLPASLPWHPFIGLYATLALAAALVSAIFFMGKESQSLAFPTLLALSLGLVAGWDGALIGLGALLALYLLRIVPVHRWLVRSSAALLIAVLICQGFVQLQSYLPGVMAHYVDLTWLHVPAAASGATLQFPSVSASVREGQQVSFPDLLAGVAFFKFLGVVGGLGFLLLLFRRPATLLLLPLYLVGLSSVWTGARFAMFAVVPTTLGLMVLLGWGLQHDWGLRRPGWIGRLFTAVLTAAMLPMFYLNCRYLPADPAISKSQAEALAALGAQAEGDGTVWTWWDYGYAANHFAALESLADGSRNSGQYLFTLGIALGSHQLNSSAKVMRLAASSDEKPWVVWDTWTKKEMAAWLDGVGDGEVSESSGPAQYLMVSWDTVKLLPWIQYYGSWDFERQAGSRSNVVQLGIPGNLDIESGVLQSRDGGIVNASSVDVLSPQGSQHYDYTGNAVGPHVLVNEETAEVLLLDDMAYESTLVQLLIRPLNSPLPDGSFRLVVAKDPGARVYRLVPVQRGDVY